MTYIEITTVICLAGANYRAVLAFASKILPVTSFLMNESTKVQTLGARRASVYVWMCKCCACVRL